VCVLILSRSDIRRIDVDFTPAESSPVLSFKVISPLPPSKINNQKPSIINQSAFWIKMYDC
jgi:hypothetical protein